MHNYNGYMSQRTGKPYNEVNMVYSPTYHNFLENKERYREDVDVVFITMDDILNMPWDNLIKVELSGTHRLGIEWGFYCYAEIDGKIVEWAWDIEKHHEHGYERYLEINTGLISKLMTIIKNSNKECFDFVLDSMSKVYDQMEYNCRSLHEDYLKQNRYLCDCARLIGNLNKTS